MRKKRVYKEKYRFTPLTVILFALLALYTLSMLFLLFWALMTSFKSQGDFRLNIVGLPKKFVWNYSFVFEKFKYPVLYEGIGTAYINVGYMFLYTLLYAGGCAVTQTLTPCITAYCCARYKYRFGKAIVFVVLLAMSMPIIGSLPSEIQIAKFLGFYDNIWGLWLMKANFLGVYFLVFLGVFRGIPKEFDEAAKIDGAGDFTIMLRIILPTVLPTVFTVMLLNFIGYWNDYQVPLIYLPHYPTISLGLQYMMTTTDNDLATVPMRMTASMLVLLPILAIFVATQKYLVGNVTVGGVKG